jgi:hypothetical protein
MANSSKKLPQIHHDVNGWYIVRPAEEAMDELGYGPDGISLGFDGREHYTSYDEAFQKIGVNISNDK